MNEYEGYVVVCLSDLLVNEKTNQPSFMVKVYGPYGSPREAEDNAKMIKSFGLEGGGVMVRPLVNLGDTLGRLNVDQS